MSDWIEETFDDRTRFALRVTRRLDAIRSRFQAIEVVETEAFGRVLVLDGIFQTSERDEHVYHEMLVHPAMVTAPAVGRVLVIGGGDGGTVREVLRHPAVEHCVLVEIDCEVVETSRRYLPTIGTAWEDPRLEIVFADGVAYVRDAPRGSFDLVILDGSDPVGPSAGLFDRAFYERCRRAIAPGGLFATQSESPFLTPVLFSAIVGTLAEVFGHAAPALASVPLYAAGPWSFTLACEHPVPGPARDDRVAAVEDGCRYWSREIQQAAFVLPSDVRRLVRQEPAGKDGVS